LAHIRQLRPEFGTYKTVKAWIWPGTDVLGGHLDPRSLEVEVFGVTGVPRS